MSIPEFGQPLHMTGWLQKVFVAVQKGNKEIALETSFKKAQQYWGVKRRWGVVYKQSWEIT